MSLPWIAVVVSQTVVIMVLALVQIGTLRRLLPLVEHASQPPAASPPPPPGPPSGTVLPDVTVRLGNGGTVSTAQLLGQPFVMLFVEQDCASCRSLLQQLASPIQDPPHGPAHFASPARLYIVADPHRLNGLPVPTWATPLLDPASRISQALGITATPMAVAIDAAGTVTASAIPGGAADLERLTRARPEDHTHIHSGHNRSQA